MDVNDREFLLQK